MKYKDSRKMKNRFRGQVRQFLKYNADDWVVRGIQTDWVDYDPKSGQVVLRIYVKGAPLTSWDSDTCRWAVIDLYSRFAFNDFWDVFNAVAVQYYSKGVKNEKSK